MSYRLRIDAVRGYRHQLCVLRDGCGASPDVLADDGWCVAVGTMVAVERLIAQQVADRTTGLCCHFVEPFHWRHGRVHRRAHCLCGCRGEESHRPPLGGLRQWNRHSPDRSAAGPFNPPSSGSALQRPMTAQKATTGWLEWSRPRTCCARTRSLEEERRCERVLQIRFPFGARVR